jgi:hypothetical protein
MSTKFRHDGKRQTLTAAAARTSGVACMEAGFHGVPYTNPAINERYALDIEGVHEFATIASAAVGDTVFINLTTFALTRAAKGTATPGGTEPFGRIVAIPGTTDGPPTGFIWVKQLPQLP